MGSGWGSDTPLERLTLREVAFMLHVPYLESGNLGSPLALVPSPPGCAHGYVILNSLSLRCFRKWETLDLGILTY